MTEIVDLSKRRQPVTYTVTITHHWDDTLEVFVADVADDERSRASVADALHRASQMFGPLAPAQPAPQGVVHEEQNTEQRKVFWNWLPLAYRDGHLGEEPKFTKYNMEVAHYAGWCAALTSKPVDDSLAADPAVKDVCEKCGGEGWLWAHELDNYYNPDNHSPMNDQTRYSCDGPKHAQPTLAEALAVPEVKALVEAANEHIAFMEGTGLTFDFLGKLRAALRQIGGEV